MDDGGGSEAARGGYLNAPPSVKHRKGTRGGRRCRNDRAQDDDGWSRSSARERARILGGLLARGLSIGAKAEQPSPLSELS